MIDQKTLNDSDKKRKRVSVMYHGDIYNQRKQQREALSQAIQDYHGTIP